jgi:2-iminobutanoate/2-iminopropanoate deaminase
MPKAEQVYHKRELEKGFYYAQAVKAGNTLYVSGCVSWDATGRIIGEGDMRAQVNAVYTDLKATLAAHGATLKHVVKETVFTTDMEALKSHNNLRMKFYTDDDSAPPASTWIGCTCLAVPGFMLEVECVAVLG